MHRIMNPSAQDNEKVIKWARKNTKNILCLIPNYYSLLFSTQPSTFISAPKPLRSAHSAIMQIALWYVANFFSFIRASSSFYELFYIQTLLCTWILHSHFYFRRLLFYRCKVEWRKKKRELRAAWIGGKLWDAGNNINRFKDDNEILLDKQITVPISLYNTCINNKRSKFDKVYEQDPQFFISPSRRTTQAHAQKLNNFVHRRRQAKRVFVELLHFFGIEFLFLLTCFLHFCEMLCIWTT
jgi:hypothetical protein